MTKTELKKMTVADVLKTPEYVANLEKLLNLLWESRQKARFKAHAHNQALKAHPIDMLHEEGIWQPQEFIFEYMAVIDKESQFSSAAREYIREVGTSAYVTTIKQIQNAPKKRMAKGQKDENGKIKDS